LYDFPALGTFDRKGFIIDDSYPDLMTAHVCDYRRDFPKRRDFKDLTIEFFILLSPYLHLNCTFYTQYLEAPPNIQPASRFCQIPTESGQKITGFTSSLACRHMFSKNLTSYP
jgi:hypothetical protein